VSEPAVIEVHLSLPSTDKIAQSLRSLTRRIHRSGLANSEPGGLFGGEWGYGCNFENETFLMHRFCWCESSDCPWCAGCTCPPSAFHHFIDGNEVASEEYIRFYDDAQYGAGLNFDDWCGASKQERAKMPNGGDAVRPRMTSHCDAICDSHRNAGIFERFGGPAPNFWHFASGARISWCKYIGRGMEISGGEMHGWPAIFRSCRQSLGPCAKGEAK
jgi:hypothetical protein